MTVFEYEENGIKVEYAVIKDSIQELNGYPCFKIMTQFTHNGSGIRTLWFDAEDFNQVYYKTEKFAEMILRDYLYVNNKNFKERSIIANGSDKCTFGGSLGIFTGR